MHEDRAREDREAQEFRELAHMAFAPLSHGCRCDEARLPAVQIALAYLVAALAMVVVLAGVPLAVLLWRVVL